jgi:hypothetical protein
MSARVRLWLVAAVGGVGVLAGLSYALVIAVP